MILYTMSRSWYLLPECSVSTVCHQDSGGHFCILLAGSCWCGRRRCSFKQSERGGPREKGHVRGVLCWSELVKISLSNFHHSKVCYSATSSFSNGTRVCFKLPAALLLLIHLLVAPQFWLSLLLYLCQALRIINSGLRPERPLFYALYFYGWACA